MSSETDQGDDEATLARIEAALDRLDHLTDPESLRRTAADSGADSSDSAVLAAENAEMKARLDALLAQESAQQAALGDAAARVDRAIGTLDTVLKG
ncbi:MAG: hypothetical protein P1U65_10885 [Minwuia sp.]|nr:hypothetical protein [Minwuia sp.]